MSDEEKTVAMETDATEQKNASASSSSVGEKRKHEEEEEEEDEPDEPQQDVDLLSLSDVPEVDPSAHKKVIGVYTEKGGVGKTNFILSCVRSGVFNTRILVIDTDPQNNVVNGFMTPTIVKPASSFMNCADFVSDSFRDDGAPVTVLPINPDGKQAFTVCRDAGASVTIILGAPLSDSGDVFDSERNFTIGGVKQPKTAYAKQLIAHIRHQLSHYDVVFIDFNPKMSLINKILLMACDEVVQLVTGDIHSQSAISSLSATREEECKIFQVGGSHFPQAGPRRFNISITPSLIDRSRKSLRQGHKAFVEKIFYFVKEKFTSGCNDLFFRGYVGRSHSMYGERPIKLLLSQKEPGSRADVAKMVEDVKRVLLHCIKGTKEDMTRHPTVFPWKVAKSHEESASILNSLKPDHKSPLAILYILRAADDPDLYKVGYTKSSAKRLKAVTGQFKRDWQFVKGFVSTKAVVMDLEDKLLDYFSTSADVGETVMIRPHDARSTLFLASFAQLEDRGFVESLLLES